MPNECAIYCLPDYKHEGLSINENHILLLWSTIRKVSFFGKDKEYKIGDFFIKVFLAMGALHSQIQSFWLQNASNEIQCHLKNDSTSGLYVCVPWPVLWPHEAPTLTGADEMKPPIKLTRRLYRDENTEWRQLWASGLYVWALRPVCLDHKSVNL